MKKMIRLLLAAGALTFGISASAVTLTESLAGFASNAVLGSVTTQGLNFKEGDTANYNMDMGFIKGPMEMSVEKIGSDGVWIRQLVDMMGQQQKVQILIDPNTGEIKKMLVNGQEQTPPKRGDIEVVETKEDTISVPAGSFTCVYFKVHDKTNNTNAEQWVNLREVPVFGMVKSIADSQFGPVTLELTSFKKM